VSRRYQGHQGHQGHQARYGTTSRTFTFPTANPLVNGVMVVLGFLALGAAMLLGLVVLAVFLVSLFVLAGVVGLRLWWLPANLANGTRAVLPGAASSKASTGWLTSRNDAASDAEAP